MMLLAKEHVEGSQRAVGGRDVLLQVNLIAFAEHLVGIDFLLNQPQAVAHHRDFVEESVNGHFLGLKAGVFWLENERAAVPAGTEGNDLHLVQAALQHRVQRLLNIRKGNLARRAAVCHGFRDFHARKILGDIARSLLAFEPDGVCFGGLVNDNAAAEEVVRHAGANARAYGFSLGFHRGKLG